MVNIEINNLTKIKVNENLIKKAARIVFKEESSGEKNINLSIALVGLSRIRKLNKKYRGKNQPTDVLAFGEGLNEIVICPEEVKKNAKRYALPFEKELINSLIHGILHLLGYEHEKSEKKAKEMRMKETYYLSKIYA